MNSRQWRRYLDEMFVKIIGERHYLWPAIDHEGEVPESFATKKCDKKAGLILLKKATHMHGRSEAIVKDLLRSYGAALRETGDDFRWETGRWLNNRAQNSHLPF